MSINFPAAPVEGQLFEAEGVQYVYTQGIWAVIYADPAGLEGVLFKSGGTMTGDLAIQSTGAGDNPLLAFKDSSTSNLALLIGLEDRSGVTLRKIAADGATESQVRLTPDDVVLEGAGINYNTPTNSNSLMTLGRSVNWTKRIHRPIALAVGSTYSTTVQNTWVAGSDIIGIVPSTPTSALFVTMDIVYYIQASGGSQMRASFAPSYYSGTEWVIAGSRNAGMNYTSNGNNILYGSMTWSNFWGSGARRSDTDAWNIRAMMHNPYASQQVNVASFYLRALEYEP